MPQLEQISTFSSQIFWLVVSFTGLFLVIWRFSVPKISDTLEARQKRIDDNLVRAEELKKDAEITLDAYEASLSEAHLEAKNILAAANTKLAQEAEISETKLNEVITNRMLESEKVIEASLNDAISQIREAAREVTVTAVEHLSGEKPNSDDAGSAVDLAIKNRG